MSDIALDRLLQGLTTAASAVLLVRLFSQRLGSIYPSFFAFILFKLVIDVASQTVPLRTRWYGYLFFVSTAVSWLLVYLVLRELLRKTLRDHPGVHNIARYAVHGGLALAVVVAVVAARLQAPPGSSLKFLEQFLLVHQAVMLAYAVLLIAVLSFLLWFPVTLRQNIVAYCTGFVLTSVCSAILLILRFQMPASPLRLKLSALNLTVYLLCLGFWVVRLRRDGEERTATIGHSWRPEETERLLEQLRSLNAAGMGAPRR